MQILFDSARHFLPRSGLFARRPPPAPFRSWASDEEWRAHREATTFSVAEWRSLREEARAAELDRYHREASAEAQELAELGVSPEAMDRLAEEAAQLDRVCGLATPAALAAIESDATAVVEVRTVQVRGRRYVAELIASEDEDVPAAVRLTSDRGDVYDVARHSDGRISCTCPVYTWKREGLTGEPCKHGFACAAYGLLGEAPKARRPRPTATLHQRSVARRPAGVTA